MQDYRMIKSYLLGLLSKALHPKKVYVTPKTSKIKPYWKTVYVSDKTDTAPPMRQVSAVTKSTPQHIKDIANAHQDKFMDKETFLKDLKDRGITWKESPHPAINLMRAKMALHTAIMNGTHGFGGTVPSSTSTSTTNNRRLSQGSKDKVKSFYKTFNNDKDFLDTLKKLGIQWKHNSHDRINMMKAKEALAVQIEKGFDLQSALKKLGTPTVKITIKNEPHPYSSLAKDMGTYYKSMRSIVDKVSYDSAKLWSSCERNMFLNISANNKKYYYSPKAHQIFIKSLRTLAKDSVGYKKWGVLFHEGGHSIDYQHKECHQLNIPYNGVTKTVILDLPYSAVYKDGAFAKAIHNDISRFLNQYNLHGLENERQALMQELRSRFDNLDSQWFINNGFARKNCKKKETLFKELLGEVRANHLLVPDKKKPPPTEEQVINAMAVLRLREKHSDKIKKVISDVTQSRNDSEYMDFSDMLEGATYGIVRTGWGHGVEYWQPSINCGKEENLSTEAFAEMLAAEISNPESLKFIKKHLPTAYKVYQEMIQSLCEKESARYGGQP